MSAKKVQTAKPAAKPVSKEVVAPEVPETGTAPSVEFQKTVEINQRDKQRQKLGLKYKNEAMVPVNIAPFYKPYFGSQAMVSVNGISVYVPCDGRVHNIPATHAGVLIDSMDQINKNIERNNRMSNVQKNVEDGIGSMQLD